MTRRQYICSCGTFELNQSMKDDVLTKCPNCGGKCRIDQQAQQKDSFMSDLPAYIDIKVNKKTGIRKDYKERTSPYFKGINKE